MSNLQNNIVELEKDEVLKEVEERLNNGENPLVLINECNQGMTIVGEKFKNNEYFLAELILSGEIFKEAMGIINPHLTKGEKKSDKGKVILATLKGDIHDIGKNIFATLLTTEGFEVLDLGVDVDPQIVVEKVKEFKPDFIGFSALITPTFEPMKEAIEQLEKAGIRDQFKIMVGGGITTPLVKDYIKADFQTIDAMEGVKYCLDNIKIKVKV
ncbi:MAG: B12-binding domain-containing protein [Candidatus Hodarchaeota archaeon]